MSLKQNFTQKAMKELDRLSNIFDKKSCAPSPTLLQKSYGKAVWEIATANNKKAYMSAESGGIDKDLYVVNVDAQRFYYHWLLSKLVNDSGNCVPKEDMPADYKFKDAIRGFERGKENPVPLADVNVNFETIEDENGNYEYPVISFTNGVTRSFWLISNDAKSFPVSVYGQETAETLQKIAGNDSKIQSYEQLFTP